MELRDLRIFRAVAEELHFSRAAKRLIMSPATVSSAVSALERELGCRLFLRTSRTVTLTVEGQRLLAKVAGILDAVDRLSADVRPLCVRVVVPEVHPYGQVTRRLAEDLRETGIATDLALAPFTSHVQMLRSGAADIGTTVTLPGTPPDDGMIDSAPLGPASRLNAMLPAGHELARLDPLPLQSLAKFPVHTMPRDADLRVADATVAAFRAAGVELQEVDNAGQQWNDAVQQTVVSMAWVVVIDAVRAYPPPGVVVRPLPQVAMSVDIRLIWRRDLPAEVIRRIRTFLAGHPVTLPLG